MKKIKTPDFNLYDILEAISNKYPKIHPHVFLQSKLELYWKKPRQYMKTRHQMELYFIFTHIKKAYIPNKMEESYLLKK